MKPFVLFVDDDPNVLDGLKRMLYSIRKEWDMAFCLGARQALETMEERPPDILVTDLLMPEVDGGKFLEAVHERHPDTIRIVLSGYSSCHHVLTASRYAHQFLAKPLRPEELIHTLKRALALRGIILDPDVRKLAVRLDKLPALPETIQRILAELNMPDPSMKFLGELISQDMGLSASMLKLVNSAFFGLRTRVSNPAHAVNLLGLDVIVGLVVTTQLFSCFDASSFPEYNIDGLWQHSLNTGLVCKRIAAIEGLDIGGQDDLYVGGILHDIGKLVLLSSARELYTSMLTLCRRNNSAIWLAEKQSMGCTHAEIGAYLLSLWGFPETIIPSIAHHHALAKHTGENPLFAAIVHAGNALDHELNVVHPEYDRARLDMDALERLGFASRLPAWREAAAAALEEVTRDERENLDR